jgi:primosomal protein N' (replication factor Y) (superfamily II helicase)
VGETKPGGAAAPSGRITPPRVIARVVLDVRLPQLDRLLDYAVPQGMDLTPGVRVRVPLGSGGRLQAGWVVDITAQTEFVGSLAEVAEVVSPVRVLTAGLWQLARTVADRQAGAAADILRLAIAPRAVRVENQWLAQEHNPPTAPPEIPPIPGSYSEADWEKILVPGGKTALTLPGGVTPTSVAEDVPRGHDVLARLATTLLAQGESAIVCVPDWRDRKLILRALGEYLSPEQIVEWSADHTPSERYRNYLRCLEGNALVVVGARHAVYAPVSPLGALVVLNESDTSHQEPLAPYPHTRDIALTRQQQSQCRLVFADWSPSVDLIRLIDLHYLDQVQPRRDHRPAIIPTALTTASTQPPSPGRIPSLAHRGVSEALKDGPVLVQVFRAGFAPALACEGCGEIKRCDRCGGPLRAPHAGSVGACSWCGKPAIRRPCTYCQQTGVRPMGHGVERTVAELGKAFPRVPVVHSDGEHPVLDVSPRPALVVATRGSEPVAQGGYRAVLLLDGDRMLQRVSVGAAEETFRGWEWAASLASPNAPIYLTDVEGPAVHAFVAGATAEALRGELAERRALRLPPAIRVASVSGPGDVVRAVVAECETLAAGIDSLGPVSVGPGRVRSILRFGYQEGGAVAKLLRAAVIERSLGRSNASNRLRVVLDDRQAFDEFTRATD